MIENYVYTKITQDTALQALLTDGASGYHVYPNVVPRSVNTFISAITFTLITTKDVYPVSKSVNIQFNIFSKEHTKVAQVAEALSNLFNGDNLQNAGNVQMVYSQRISESDLGKTLDNEELYQREATYYFKIR